MKRKRVTKASAIEERQSIYDALLDRALAIQRDHPKEVTYFEHNRQLGRQALYPLDLRVGIYEEYAALVPRIEWMRERADQALERDRLLWQRAYNRNALDWNARLPELEEMFGNDPTTNNAPEDLQPQALTNVRFGQTPPFSTETAAKYERERLLYYRGAELALEGEEEREED